MSTRSVWRGLVRAELNDAGAALWTDALLNQWLLEGIREYGRALPKASSTSIAAVAGQADYSLPVDCLRVARVEHPTGFFRVLDRLAGGDVIDPFAIAQSPPIAALEQQTYEVWGVVGALTLTLRPAPTATSPSIKVQYLATWGEPSADGTEIDLPDVEEHLLIWYAAWRALQWISTDESKRQRFERQRGVSATAALGQYQREWRSAIADRQRRVSGARLQLRGL